MAKKIKNARCPLGAECGRSCASVGIELAVCPPVATALIRANCADIAYKKKLTTVAELERAIQGA